MKDRIAVVCLLFLGAAVFIPAIQYPIIHFQTSDGLPQNFVTALAQDTDGYIWVGTQSGIGIFNGEAFIRTLSSGDGLPGIYIHDLMPAPDGRMWAATDEGIAVLDHMNTVAVFLRGEAVQRLCRLPAAGETGLILTSSGELREIRSTGETVSLQPPAAMSGLRITHAVADGKGGAIALAGGKLLHYSPDGNWSDYPAAHEVDFLCRRHGRVFLAGQKLLDVPGKGDRANSMRLPANCGLIRDLDTDPDGGIWLGTDNGLFSRDSASGEWHHFDAGNGMQYSRVTRVLVDDEHSVFVGKRYGLSILSGTMFRMYTRKDGLPSEFICSLLEDAPGVILAGGYEGLAEIRNGRPRPFAINRRLREMQVRCILKAGPGDYRLGTRYNGIFRWDRKERLEQLNPDARVLNGLRDSAGVLWFGTEDGLLRHQGRRDFTLIRAGLKHSRVWAMDEAAPGMLVLGTGKGVQVFTNGRFIHSDLESLLGPVNVTDIHAVSPNEILVSTVVHGLFIYRDGHLTHLTRENGLLHNDVWYALKDSRGQIWLNTSVSLDRYKDGFLSHFNKKTGLFGDEGYIHTALETGDGSLWFSVSPGLVELPPGARSLAPVPPRAPTLIMRVEDHPLATNRPIRLTSSQNSVEFSFFTVSTRRDQPLYYRWRLLPRQKSWQGPTRRSRTNYFNLPPGNYTFEVVTDNGFRKNVPVDHLRHISFRIRAPLWMRWWFLALALLAMALFIRLATFLRLRMLESQKRRLEKRIHEHTSELARKNHELVVLSITDPLTGLKNRRYLDDRISDDVHLIERSLFQHKDDGRGRRRSEGEQRVLTFYVIDIDHFKSVNDIHGHHAGDRVLVGVAQTLRRELRTSDIIIRWGGEEFLVVTRNKWSDNSYLLAERLRQAIEAREFHLSEAQAVRRTVSVGFARFPFVKGDIRAVSWQQVISLADSAMYLAKLNGRNLSVGIEPGPGFSEVPFSQIITRMDEQAAAGRIRLFSPRHELLFRTSV